MPPPAMELVTRAQRAPADGVESIPESEGEVMVSIPEPEEGYVRRRPQRAIIGSDGAGPPAPAAAVIEPAAIVIGRPAPRIIGNPRPAVVGLPHPAAIAVGHPAGVYVRSPAPVVTGDVGPAAGGV